MSKEEVSSREVVRSEGCRGGIPRKQLVYRDGVPYAALVPRKMQALSIIRLK